MFALSLAMAVAPLSPVRDPYYYYDCEIERSTPLGNFSATSRIDGKGVVEHRSFYWSRGPALPKLSLARHWGSIYGQRVSASVGHFYGKRGQRVRFSFESLSGERLLLTDPIKRRDQYFFHSMAWDQIETMTRQSGGLRIRTIVEGGAEHGVVLSDYVLSVADLDQIDRDAAQLTADLAAMMADYKNQCSDSRDVIIMIG